MADPKMADPNTTHRPEADAGHKPDAQEGHAGERDRAEDAAQRPFVKATTAGEQPPKAGRRWAIPAISAAVAILILIVLVAVIY